MTIDIVVRARDSIGNKVYFCKRDEKGWFSMAQDGSSVSFSSYTSNAAELIIALENSTTKEEAIVALKKWGDYLKEGTIE
jgi:uncharacterized pyridoxamine 5'-phosphate oxidase family protein